MSATILLYVDNDSPTLGDTIRFTADDLFGGDNYTLYIYDNSALDGNEIYSKHFVRYTDVAITSGNGFRAGEKYYAVAQYNLMYKSDVVTITVGTPNSPPGVPSSITIPAMSEGGKASISWGTSSDPDGNLSGYRLQRQINGGNWVQIYSGSARVYVDTPQQDWDRVNYRVCAHDSYGAVSGWRTGTAITVKHNKAPAITGTDGALGSFGMTAPGAYAYTVTDADGDAVTVTEAVDGKVKRTYKPVLGQQNSLTFSAEEWLGVLNGSHTITITADDGKGGKAVRTQTFTKSVTRIEFLLSPPLDAAEMPTKAMESITRQAPAGATLQVLLCNNGFDASPTWEDVTSRVLAGEKIFLKNTTRTAAKWGYSVKVIIERNGATGECWCSGGSGFFE